MTITPDAPVAIDAEASTTTPVSLVKETQPDLSVTTNVVDLLDALKTVNAGLNSRFPMQVLYGVLLEADDAGLRLSRFDYETCNRQQINAAGHGRALVGSATLKDLVSALDKGVVTLQATNGKVEIRQDDLTYTVPTLSLDDFPALPPVGDDIAVVMTGQQLYDLRNGVLVAVSRDETLPVLTAVSFDTSDGELEVAGTDRYRLTVDRTGLPASTLGQFLVPGKVLNNAAALMKKSAEIEVRLEPWTLDGRVAGQFVTFTDGSRSITTRCVDGEFPKYKSLMPTEFTATLTADAKVLAKTVQQVAIAAARNAPVRFILGEPGQDNALEAGNTDDTHARKTLAAEFAGFPLSIAANPGYLLDGIKAVGDKTVTVQFVSHTRPFILTGDAQSTLTYLLMPVRISG